MARPPKLNVDFFPHRCLHPRHGTIAIMESTYGVKAGYSFWFKLLETLGDSPGLWFDFRSPKNQRKFLAATDTTLEECEKMIHTLVELEDIDRKLWEEKRVIWCQNFVDGLRPLFAKRNTETPHKPSFRDRNPSKQGVSGDSREFSGVFGGNNGDREIDSKDREKDRDFVLQNLKKLKPEVFNKDGSPNIKKLQTLASGTQGLLSEEYARQVLAGLNEA